jgi:plastocyanin
MSKFSIFLLTLIICTAIICGCTAPASTSSQPAASSSQPAIQTATVTPNGIVKNIEIIQRSFDPQTPPPISPGTTVTWTNKDAIVHRVVHLPQLPSEKQLFDSGPMSKGDTFSYTFQTPGEYYYGDPQMGGGRSAKIIVQ